MVVEAARSNGGVAALVVDQPHRTSARRWFLVSTPAATGSHPTDRPACCAMHAPLQAACLLSLRAWTRRHAEQLAEPLIDPEHEAWMVAEHARAAHKALRVLRRAEAVDANAMGTDAESARADVAPATAYTPTAAVARLDGGKEAIGSVVDSSSAAASSVAAASAASSSAVPSSAVASAAAGAGADRAHSTRTDEVRADPPKRRKRGKDKGFLAPSAHGEPGTSPPMSEAERHVAERLRAALGVQPGTCPSLEEVNVQIGAVLAVLHGDESPVW